MKKALSTLITFFLLTGCAAFLKPEVTINSEMFSEGPVIIEREGHFYLRWRMSSDTFLRNIIHVRIDKEKKEVYYYFVGAVSVREFGNIYERPLAYDGVEKYTQNGYIYWLNSDGSKLRIPIIKDPTPLIQVTPWN
ncbi:MAG: hypothetical protein ACMUJM_08265 [bacterium]